MKTFKVTVDGQSYVVEVEDITNNTNTTRLEKVDHDNKSAAAGAVTKPAQVTTSGAKDPKKTPATSAGSGMSVKAPMPGSVLDVKVQEGDIVNDGDVLLVLEAMKMENELTASKSGTIMQVLVKKGDTVNSGDPLIIMS